jgi:hypothetical protein
MSFDCHNYQPLLEKLCILSLKSRRIISDILFLRNLICGNINCSELLALIELYSPGRDLRHFQLFQVSLHRTTYCKFMPINRISMLANEFADHLDLFSMSHDSVRKKLYAILC